MYGNPYIPVWLYSMAVLSRILIYAVSHFSIANNLNIWSAATDKGLFGLVTTQKCLLGMI